MPEAMHCAWPIERAAGGRRRLQLRDDSGARSNLRGRQSNSAGDCPRCSNSSRRGSAAPA
jgi:hypothetical protein